MKKLFIVFAAIALLAAGCRTSQQPTVTPPESTNPDQSHEQPQTPQLQTYSNATYGIDLSYPTSMKFVTPTYAMLSEKITALGIAQTDYPKTNFGDASLSISETTAQTIAACLTSNPPENGDGFKTPVTMNGTTYYMTKSSGVGAGNLYESTIYRTLSKNSQCIELNETIHTSNIGNYPAGTVTEAPKEDIQARLDAVLKTVTIH